MDFDCSEIRYITKHTRHDHQIFHLFLEIEISTMNESLEIQETEWIIVTIEEITNINMKKVLTLIMII
jgi:hypothetical protein